MADEQASNLTSLSEMEDEDDYAVAGSSGINLNGRNVGAAMFTPRDVNIVPQEGCRVNIYVNSNVQGSCTSALLGSKVRMRDPGVHLCIGDFKIGGGDGSKRDGTTWVKIGLCVIFLFDFILTLVLLYSWFKKKQS